MTDTANLEDGFYWVRQKSYDYWEVSRVEGGFIHSTFMTYESNRESISDYEIDPRPIKREDVE